MEGLYLTLLAIFLGVTLVPLAAPRLGLPVVVAEILLGVVLGRSFLDLVPVDNPVIQFFTAFGLVYLLFLAGLEIDFRQVLPRLGRSLLLAVASLALPFAAGAFLGPPAGVHPLLMGTVFSTTSLGLVLPLVREMRSRAEFRHLLLASAVLVDLISMFLLAFVLLAITGEVGAEFFYSLVAVLALFLIPWLVNRRGVRARIEGWLADQGHFEMEVRLSFALVLGLGALVGYLGFHAILGAFIAGLIVSEITPQASRLEEKLESFGYGFFIPVFFIVMGAKVDLPAVFLSLEGLLLLFAVVALGVLAKVVGVGLVGRGMGLRWREAGAMGLFHSARLSLLLAVAEVGSDLGLIGAEVLAILVVLALVSATLSPALGRALLLRAGRWERVAEAGPVREAGPPGPAPGR